MIKTFCDFGIFSFYDNNPLKTLSFSIWCVALIRHNKPGVTAFKLANGYAGLRDALASDSVRFQR